MKYESEIRLEAIAMKRTLLSIGALLLVVTAARGEQQETAPSAMKALKVSAGSQCETPAPSVGNGIPVDFVAIPVKDVKDTYDKMIAPKLDQLVGHWEALLKADVPKGQWKDDLSGTTDPTTGTRIIEPAGSPLDGSVITVMSCPTCREKTEVYRESENILMHSEQCRTNEAVDRMICRYYVPYLPAGGHKISTHSAIPAHDAYVLYQRQAAQTGNAGKSKDGAPQSQRGRKSKDPYADCFGGCPL